MANYRNEFEFRSGLLNALGVEHTEADAKNEERWRAKMLDGLEVEYNQNDVNQFDLFRAKLVEGVEAKAEGGGGGSSDFSTAEVTAGIGVAMDAPVVINEEDFQGIATIGAPMEEETTWQVPLYKGKCMVSIYALEEGQTISVSGDITEINEGTYLITGDCTITIS